MKKAFFFIVFILCSLYTFSGELTIQPPFPKEGDSLRFTYLLESNQKTSLQDKIFIYIYTSTKALPDAYEIPLILLQNKLQGSFKIPKFAIYGLIKVRIGGNIDNNHNNMWDFYVYTGAKVQKNANLIAGVSYLGKNPETIEREVDFDKALEYLRKEVENYPNNIEGQIAYISLQYDLRLLAKSDFEKKLNEALNIPFDKNNESEIRAVIRAYNALNKTNEANKLQKDYVDKFKWSELAQESKLSEIAQAKTLEKFSDLIVDFLMSYPRSPSRDKLFSALISGYLQANKYRELRSILAKFNEIPSSALSQLAFAIAEDRTSANYIEPADKMNEAFSIMKYAVTSAKENKALDKPSYFTYTEWEELSQEKYAIALEGLGKLFFMNSEYQNAIDNLFKAKQILEDNSSEAIYEYLIQSHLNINKDSLAFILSTEAIRNNKATEFVYQINQKYFNFYNPSHNYQDFLNSLENEAKKKRLNSIKKEMFNKQVIIPSLDSFERLNVNLNEAKGKIIILAFWATWCEPCKNLLLKIDDLYKSYKDVKNIQFYAVNVWEKSNNPRSDIKNYLKDTDISIPLLLDGYNEMPYRLSFTGLPTTIVIDSNGLLQFKITGITSDDSFYQKIVDIIELLSN